MGRHPVVQIYHGVVFPLGPLNANLDHGQLGSPDAEVGGLHHCDGKPDLDISTCPGAGLLQLGNEADGQAFQCGLCLLYEQAVQ